MESGLRHGASDAEFSAAILACQHSGGYCAQDGYCHFEGACFRMGKIDNRDLEIKKLNTEIGALNARVSSLEIKQP